MFDFISFPGLNTHAYDYNLFFNNIRKNALDRVRAWEAVYPTAMKVEREAGVENRDVGEDPEGEQEVAVEVGVEDWLEIDDWIIE